MLAENYMKNIEYERKIGKAEGRSLGRLEGIKEKEKKVESKNMANLVSFFIVM